MDSPTFGRSTLADQPWPVEDLEPAPECMVCGGRERSAWRTELSDRVFRTSPGRWTLWRCAQCGAAQLDPRPTPDAIGRAYSTYFTHQGPEKNFLVPGDRPDLRLKRALHLSFYNRRYGYRHPGAMPLGWTAITASRWRSARAGQFIRHLPGPAPDAQLLDVGCGDGGFMRLARALGYRAMGIEFDAASATLARAQGFEVRIGSIDAAEVLPHSVDQITMSHVVEHLHDPLATLRRLREWLRPGGRLWLQTPNIDSSGANRYGVCWRGLEPPRHLVMFNAGSLRLALQSAGFESIELLAPQLDAQFYIGQSEAIRSGLDPYQLSRDARRAARGEGRAWDLAAPERPEQAESLTMIAFRTPQR